MLGQDLQASNHSYGCATNLVKNWMTNNMSLPLFVFVNIMNLQSILCCLVFFRKTWPSNVFENRFNALGRGKFLHMQNATVRRV